MEQKIDVWPKGKKYNQMRKKQKIIELISTLNRSNLSNSILN